MRLVGVALGLDQIFPEIPCITSSSASAMVRVATGVADRIVSEAPFFPAVLVNQVMTNGHRMRRKLANYKMIGSVLINV